VNLLRNAVKMKISRQSWSPVYAAKELEFVFTFGIGIRIGVLRYGQIVLSKEWK
jgi:hypothetical protein